MVPRIDLEYTASMSPRTKVLAYVRISSMRQVNNESPATQREAIQRYADANNFEIVRWFEDIAQSAKNADRSGLQEMLKYALSRPKGEIEHWVVYNMKRASRDVESYTIQVRTVLYSRGITIRSATEQMIDDSAFGRFAENLFVSLGQYENDGKAAVTKDNMRRLAEQGYYQHPPVVGYEVHKVPNENGQLRPTLKPTHMAERVAAVLERYSIGDISKAELTRYAAEVGLRSRYGKQLSKDSIHRLLKNPTYAGYICDKFTEYKLVQGKHPAIISPSTFDQNQSLLYPRSSRKNEVHLSLNPEYCLKGFLLCSSCSLPLYASAPKTGAGGHSPRYHCARKSCRGRSKSVRASLVHSEFNDVLTKLQPEPGLLKLYKEILIREANSAVGRLNAELMQARERLSALDASRLKTLDKFTNDQISIDEKNELIGSYDLTRTELSAKVHDLERQQFIREADIEVATDIMNDVARQWALSDVESKVRFQKLIFPEGVVYDTVEHRFGTKFISPLYRYVGIEKDAEAPLESYLVAGAGLEPATSWL